MHEGVRDQKVEFIGVDIAGATLEVARLSTLNFVGVLGKASFIRLSTPHSLSW